MLIYNKPKSKFTKDNIISMIGAFILFYCMGCQISFTMRLFSRLISSIISAYICMVAELGTKLSNYIKRDYRWKIYKMVIFMIGGLPGSLLWALAVLKNENLYFEIAVGVVCGIWWGIAYDLIYLQSLTQFFIDRPFLTLNLRDVSLVLGIIYPFPTIISTIIVSALPFILLNISEKEPKLPNKER